MRKLKTIGVAMIAVFAMSAVAASSASAVLPDFHSEVETTWIVGTQHVRTALGTPAGTVKCGAAATDATVTQADITGTKIAASNFTKDELSLTPTCNNATAFGQAATVAFNGCTFEINTPTTLVTGDAWLKCPAGQTVTVNVPAGNCSIHINEQGSTTTPIPGDLDYKAEGATTTRDVTATSTLKEIKYTVTGPGSICGTIGAHADATYTGAFTIKGFSNAAETTQVGIWIE